MIGKDEWLYVLEIKVTEDYRENPFLYFEELNQLINFMRIWEKHSNNKCDFHISHETE